MRIKKLRYSRFIALKTGIPQSMKSRNKNNFQEFLILFISVLFIFSKKEQQD